MTGAARRSHLDPLEDRAEADQLAVGVEVEQLVGQAVSAPGIVGEPGQQRRPHRGRADVRRGPREIVRVERRLALLGAAALVATDGAPVEAGDRPDPPGDGRPRRPPPR